MAKFVSHTSASQTVDGAKGQYNKMKRGSSVIANEVAPGGSQKASLRTAKPTGSDGGGILGSGVKSRVTPGNQHGITGAVEPASKQPK